MESIFFFILFFSLIGIGILATLWILLRDLKSLSKDFKSSQQKFTKEKFLQQIKSMNSTQINAIHKSVVENKNFFNQKSKAIIATAFFTLTTVLSSSAQDIKGKSIFGEAGIIITLFLLFIPLALLLFLFVIRLSKLIRRQRLKNNIVRAERFTEFLKQSNPEEIELELEVQRSAINFELRNTELSGLNEAEDKKGIINVRPDEGLPFVPLKKRAIARAPIDPKLSKLVLWYIITATFWLLFGTTIGEYVGIKFVAPDADHFSWLSFGRLRPVHTNSVFWGWASLAMLGLGYYVVPRVGNNKLYSYKIGWWTLYLINATVVFGTIALMAGINNGGGEYREYIWPIMLLFGIGLIITLYNYLKTIAARKTTEIYISNWYIVSAVMFGLVIAIVAYIPYWQNGLGETIVQGYYMHQGVGMWFMLFTLGLVYYYLPQHLNKPIYSYSLGILAFWTQILFYTLIGSHHFVFSSIPWWLQTVAIFGSVGMVIPVVAGTTNFLLTFKNGWYRLADSYTLPFFLVGTIFYFTGSLQGTAEAFRNTNLIWHFTDFTVAHSHLTMYGIICFFVWACIYTVVPRLTHREAPQITIGAHFWLALIGLLFYTIPLMYGSTLKGLMWIDGKPFIESVSMMAPHWLWRAIGGSLMWLSHIFFAYNLYRMMPINESTEVNEKVVEILENEKTKSL